MPQVVKLPLAETDLDDLWWYIAQDLPLLTKVMKKQGDNSQPQP